MDVGSVNSTPAPAVRYMTADDWTSHREQIALLYRDENKTLKETMDTVEAEHRLKATVKMWKSKITEWGLDKNNKKEDVLAMLRKKSERDAAGKKTAFKLRGRDVDFKNVQRYATRNHISATSIAELVASHPQTPPDLQCLTPSPVPESITGRDMSHVQEQILRRFKNVMVGSFENKTWTPAPDDLGVIAPTLTSTMTLKTEYARHHFFSMIVHAKNIISEQPLRRSSLISFLHMLCRWTLGSTN